MLLPVTSSTSLDGVIYDPLRKDEIHAQLLQLQHHRTFPIEIKAPRLRFGRGAYTFPREYFSNKRVLQLNRSEPTMKISHILMLLRYSTWTLLLSGLGLNIRSMNLLRGAQISGLLREIRDCNDEREPMVTVTPFLGSI